MTRCASIRRVVPAALERQRELVAVIVGSGV
jgi:hypothetical protein